MPKVYIIIVNWNGWRDTIECLESVYRLHYENFSVIVCDNNSNDGSMEHISAWARGELAADCTNLALQSLSFPPFPKPLPLRTILPDELLNLHIVSKQLFLVQTGANLGFAGGNNVGLRLAFGAGDLDYVWLLNNDTVVDPQSLATLVERMEQCPDAGICGSQLLYYAHPKIVQALGGSEYNHWTARGGHLGAGFDHEQTPSSDWVESRMKYVVGASMLVSKKFLEDVGQMDESYFLYFEEIDWATRAKGRFRFVYSRDSLVYHKEGASIGTSNSVKMRSDLCEFYTARNRLLFTIRYYPYALICVTFFVLLSVLHRLATGRIKGGMALLRGISYAMTGRIGGPIHERG